MKARRGTVALVVALAAPMLLASTGLSVDVGFWYQQQESLQSAADTAAVAAALSDGVLGQTTASGKQAASQPLAVTAADDATNSQFGFAAGKGGAAVAINANLTSTNSSGESTVTTTQFTATAQAPRGTFFSSVSGVGVAGMVPGKQYASATTQTTSVYGPICLDATAPSGAGTIYTGNGASGSGFFGVNCGFYDNSTACGGGTNDAIVDSNTPMVIQATTIRTAGCAYSDFTNGINPGLGSVAQKQTSAPDPYGSMDSSCTSATTGSCMTWPAAASVSGNATCLTGEMQQYPATSSKSSSECSGATNFPVCTLSSNNGNVPLFASCKLGSTIVSECESTSWTAATCNLLANSVAGAASTSFYVGLYQAPYASQWNMNCSSVSYTGSISAGNLKMSCGTPANSTAETTDIFSDLDMSNINLVGVLNIQTGNIVSTATSCLNAFASNNEQCALIFGGTALNVGGTFGANDNGTYTFTGGILLAGAGSIPTENFYPGTYHISALPGSDDISNPTAGGAMLIGDLDNVTFGAVSSGTVSPSAVSTYYFNGGLNVSGGAHVTFGPGIYYIENGDLFFGSGSSITADGATFVFEGDAAYVMNGKAAFAMTAPGVAGTSYANTPCVQPSAFVAGATGGKGICGILFYQARNDSAADTISEGAGSSGNNTIDGEIYAPSAPLTLTGKGTLTAGPSDTFGIVQYSFNSGTTGGTLQVEEPAGSPSSPIVGTTTAQPYIIK